MKTKVKFLIDKPADIFTKVEEMDSLGVFAYFPEIKHNDELNTCYAHIGQHSGCYPQYAEECKEANYNQYQDLLKELISIGYTNLEVLNTQEMEAHRKPTIGEIKFGEGATHYRTFPVSLFINKKGELKSRIIADDGLMYSRI
jgi:hypothetical protein